MATTATTSAPPPLPLEIVVQVLQHVTLQQCLGACARVCRTWRTAANAATQVIELKTSDQSRITGVAGWIHKGSSQLARLCVEGRYAHTCLHLPCLQLTQLEELELSFVVLSTTPDTGVTGQLKQRERLSLECLDLSTSTVPQKSSSGRATAVEDPTASTSDSGSSGGSQHMPLAALSRLTSLQLTGCDMQLHDLRALSTLSSLRQLQLASVDCPDLRQQEDYAQLLDTAVGAALSHLVQLTQLHISDFYGPDALAHISCLQQVRGLNLSLSGGLLSSPTLPTSLTCLVMDSVDIQAPSVLSRCVQLQHLSFEECLVPGSNGCTALLAAVASMAQLQHLVIETDEGVSMPVVAAAAYSALTASSKLTLLRFTSAEGPALPIGAGRHMFAAGRQLPCLQALHLHFDAAEGVPAPEQQAVCQQDIDSLFRACSGLRELDVYFGIDDGPEVEPLQLHGLLALKTCLTRLALHSTSSGITRVGEEQMQQVLSQLIGLQELIMHGEHGLQPLSYVGLLHLTQLRQLRELSVHRHPNQIEKLDSKAAEGCPPDVWQQLQDLCMSRSVECMRLVMQQRDDQLAAANSQLVASHAQLAASHAQLEAARAEAAAARAEVSRLQQQLAVGTSQHRAA